MNVLARALLLASLIMAGCAPGTDAPKTVDAAMADLNLSMRTKVNPQSLAFWDITNNAMDKDGNLDASKLTPAQWVQLLGIGKALEEGGHALAASKGIIAAAPGVKLQDEGAAGASTAADVQRYVDAQPAVFRDHARELEQTGASIIQAGNEKNSKSLSDLSSSLDTICENCHVIFWYPQQQKKN